MFKPYSYCHQCGSEYENSTWPRICLNDACAIEVYRRLDPVAVLLQPVRNRDKVGLLIGRRSIQPKLGEWGLPGGFVNFDDPSVQFAAKREMREETGLEGFRPRLFDSHNTNRGQMLIFAESRLALDYDELTSFVPSDECDEIDVAFEPIELCFPTHTAAMRDWFAARGRLLID